MQKKDSENKRKLRTITMSDKVHKIANDRANSLDMTLSSYITYLILKDK